MKLNLSDTSLICSASKLVLDCCPCDEEDKPQNTEARNISIQSESSILYH